MYSVLEGKTPETCGAGVRVRVTQDREWKTLMLFNKKVNKYIRQNAKLFLQVSAVSDFHEAFKGMMHVIATV